MALAVVSSAVVLPKLASACAVCTSGRDDESNAAFLVSTIFLSLLPLAALGTLVFVLWRRIQKLEAATGGSEPSRAAGVSTAAVTAVASPTVNPAH